MRLCAPIAAAILAMALAACGPGYKPHAATPAPPTPASAAVAPPSEPLSVPQTRVQLPPPQPVDPEALVVPPRTTLPPAPVQPAGSVRRLPTTAAAGTPPKPEPAPPAAVVTDPPPPPQPAIQEVLPEGQRNQLQEKAAASRKRIRQWLESSTPQHLTGQAKQTRDRIQSFLKASDDAEHRGDMREAVQLAERAEILIRELQGGH